MRISYKTRKTISQALSVVLLCALGFTAIFGVSALSNKLKEETQVIHPTFEVGGIGADGKGNRADDTIYTKEAFECAGLEVKLDFDAQIEYSIFYYTEMDELVNTDEGNTESKKFVVPLDATHARIVVTPIWDKEVEEEDRVCHWYDVTKYSSQLEIKVLKEQTPSEIKSVQLISAINTLPDTMFTDDSAYTDLAFSQAGYMYKNASMLSGKRITKIGLPVGDLKDGCANDNYFTIYVVKGNYQNAEVVNSKTLTIVADTYTVDAVNEWVYFDVNIQLAEGETLVFGSANDTIEVRACRTTVDSKCNAYWKVFTDGVSELPSYSLLFDIYVAK